MVFFLGIDGGGTGCRAVLADAQGQILGRGAAGPANVRSDTEGTLRNILAAVGEAGAGHALDLGAVTAVLGLAGANVTAAADRLAQMLPFAQARIVSDGETALHGALGGADGIMAALGTGSVFERQYQGQIRQVGGRGFVLGDEASGAALGRALLARALRAEDGLLPMTPLLAAILDDFGGGEGIIAWGFAAAPVEFAALAPRVTHSQDPAAQAIMAEAFAQLREILQALQPEGTALPVVFVGGLGPIYAKALAQEVTLREAQGSAVDGALSLALALRTGQQGPG